MWALSMKSHSLSAVTTWKGQHGEHEACVPAAQPRSPALLSWALGAAAFLPGTAVRTTTASPGPKEDYMK